MGKVIISKTNNLVTVQSSARFFNYETGVLQAVAGSSGGRISISDTDTNKKVLNNFDITQLVDSSDAVFGTTVSAAVTAVNAVVNAAPDTLIKSTDKVTALDGVTASDFTGKSGYAVIVDGTDLNLSTSGKLLFNNHDELKLGADLDLSTKKIYTTATNGDIELEPNGTGDVKLGNYTLDGDQSVGSDQNNYVLTYDHSSTKISLEEASSGGTTTDTPTATFPTSGQQGSTMTGTIDNHISSATYVGKVFNSSGVDQSVSVTIDGSGNISLTAPNTVATGYELRIFCADIGHLRSNTLTKTFAVTQQTSFTIWRTQFVDSSGNASTARPGLVELELFPSQNAGGTHEPIGNATSNTSITDVVISSGYTRTSYEPWRAFDGTTGAQSGSMWWGLGNTTAANTWIQVRFASAKTFQSIRLHIFAQFSDATHFKVLGSNDGTNFITALDTTAIVENGNDTSITHNF